MLNIEELLEKLGRIRLLVVGDVMLDHYVWGQVRRISPEAPVPVVEAMRDEYLLGGAANVANNLVDLGVRTAIMSMVGQDVAAAQLIGLLQGRGIGSELLTRSVERPTTIKTRILAGQQQMLRLDREEIRAMEQEETAQVLSRLEAVWDSFDAVILSDYGKGFLSLAMLDGIRALKQKSDKLVVVDPKSRSFDRYRGFSCITPNQLEAETALSSELDTEDRVSRLGRQMRQDLDLEALLITLGRRGMMLCSSGSELYIAAQAREVFDVTGAGDTVISVLTAVKACGVSWEDAAKLANGAAGVVVGKLGAATVSKEEFAWVIQKL
ncbi:MAG: D-glycero-beta-D-manno-heptose-7-phosphate kinase [Candidatus Cloacimonetes bacterium]|nr:D-glycero-beta-D-manno-heptose-7-phosphate kinase [Candidatus Cloacimonadota bacterium]